MERTNQISEDCDQLLLQDSESYAVSNVGFNKNVSSDEDEEGLSIELRNKDFTKRYAEVSQSYPESTAATSVKRFSDLKLEAFTNIRLYSTDDERQSLIQEEALVDTSVKEVDQRNSSMTDTGILAEDECTTSESACSETSSNKICEISLLERLLRTHSLWFIPGIQRSGAVHLLQGKEVGTFIVRGSSQQNTMAISVRLPAELGPYIEHYLIISQNGVLSLENSREKFESIPALIAHYSSVCEELPVQLCLPKSIREITNRQKLSSLALLGQEFWQSNIASPKSDTEIKSPDTSSGIGLTIFSSNTSYSMDQNECLSPVSDTISTISSFSLNNTQQILSPTSSNSFSCSDPSPIIGKTSTFKLPSTPVVSEPFTITGMSRSSSGSSNCSHTSQKQSINLVSTTRPTTLNLKSPPTPPPRLSKISMTPSDHSNFSVTFTFSTPQQQQLNTGPFPCDTKRLSPEGQCNIKDISNSEDAVLTIDNEKCMASGNKRNRRKESKHYQEFNLLESTSSYCRSGLSEKQSDYEDLWSQNDAINSSTGRTFSSFRGMIPNKIDSNSNEGVKTMGSSSTVLTPINVHTNISTNPFLSKLHQSSTNLCNAQAIGHDTRIKQNRFSWDFSSNNITQNNKNKDWIPFENSTEFDELCMRKVTDDTLKTAHLEGKRRGIAFDSWMSNDGLNSKDLNLLGSQSRCSINRNSNILLHKLILNKFPDLSFERANAGESDSENYRQSKYDNVDGCRYSDTTYSDGTRYSDPWHWEYQISDTSSIRRPINKTQKTATIASRHRVRETQNILIHPQNRSSNISPGESVEAYALELAKNSSSTFAKNVENFICCTKESHETSPQVVMRNMRQFMSGMKNYLVKHGEGNFQEEVQQACSRLKPNEFLNLDTILENVMHILVVLPLKEHLYKLFVDFYTNSGDLKLLIDNIKLASEYSPADLGIEESKITLPDGPELLNLSMLIHRMEELELPLEKLNVLFTLVSTIFKYSKNSSMNADDFLPTLIYVVAKTGFVSSEIEAEFIWGLINPSLHSGEAGYFLTTVCSAVHTLKTLSLDINQKATSGLVQTTNPSSILKVVIPDESNGSIQSRTIPIRPNTTVREISRIIAHKAQITNSQDYGLFKLVGGEEILLADNDCPQEVSVLTQKKCVFIFHRLDAKIAWPTQ